MVAIKMEMPTCCSQCDLCVEDKYADMTCVLLGTDWDENNYYKKQKDKNCPLVEIGTCKDCKHWKDSDGVYRRGISAESKCPINILQVFDGDFYCADFEKRGSKNE